MEFGDRFHFSSSEEEEGEVVLLLNLLFDAILITVVIRQKKDPRKGGSSVCITWERSLTLQRGERTEVDCDWLRGFVLGGGNSNPYVFLFPEYNLDPGGPLFVDPLSRTTRMKRQRALAPPRSKRLVVASFWSVVVCRNRPCVLMDYVDRPGRIGYRAMRVKLCHS